MSWGYWHSLDPKSNIRKISNIQGFELYQVFMHDFLRQSSYMVFYAYSLYTYCLQEDSTQFSLRLSTNFRLKVSRQFGIKSDRWKISIIHKDFELCSVFIYNFLCQTVPKFLLYILFIYYSNYLLLD